MILKKKTPNSDKVLAVMDLGSSKIAVAFFEGSGASPKLLAYNEKKSQGFKSGYITDPDLLADQIVDLIEDCESQSQQKIEGLHLGFSSNGFRQESIEETLFLNGQVITNSNIIEVSNKVANSQTPSGYNCYRVKNRAFILDGVSESISLVNPEGLYCHSLGLRAMRSLINKSICINLEKLFSQLSISLYSLHNTSEVSSEVILNSEEKELGAISIDIGAYSTKVHLFLDNYCDHSKFISIGGNDITSDIAKGLPVSTRDAERIKCLDSSCTASQFEHKQILNYQRLSNKQIYETESSPEMNINPITKGEVQTIILARLDEIFEQIGYFLTNVNHPASLSRSVVITGEGSNLVGLEDRASNYLSRQVRTLSRIKLQNKEIPTSIYGMIVSIFEKKDNSFWPREQTTGLFDGLSKFLRFH